MNGAGVGSIRRRRIIYVSGYDPRGPQGYFELFRRTCERSQRLWPVSFTLRPHEIESEDFAHWRLDMSGAGWLTTTHYDFLRLERFIRSDVAASTARQILRGLAWLADDVASGALLRIFRASWRFGAHLLFFQLLLLAWIAVVSATAIVVGRVLGGYFGFPLWAAIVGALLAGILVTVALRPIADKWLLMQISNSWTNSRRFGRGLPTWLDAAVDAGARRAIAVARANEADELVVVAHSSGCVIASAIVARALELEPDLGKNGPRLVLLTLGSVMPAVALHPAAQRMRAIVGKLAVANSLAWIDCQASKDVMCFADFDPVAGIGLRVGKDRCNPRRWPISFKDMIAPAKYARFRRNYFRMHYQYIMGGDRRAPYDYLLLVGGPAPIAQWPNRAPELTIAFADGRAKAECWSATAAPQ